MPRFLRHSLLAGLALCLTLTAAGAHAEDNKEYLVKAAFIYNFVKFTEWPDGKAIARQSNIDICVVGSSPLSDTGSVFKAASTDKLTLSLVQENNPKNIASHCHIAFIGNDEQGRLAGILAALKGQPVLTVSDIDGFAEQGGMVEFVTNDNKIKLEINTRPTAAAGMRIDPQLLEVALKVIR